MPLRNALLPIWFIACACGGALLGHGLARRPLTGLAVGSIVGVSPLALLGIAYALTTAWRPDQPECRCGRCSSAEYEFVGMHERTGGDRTYAYRCPSCGRRYRSEGPRFLEVLPDGSERSYMRASRWGRWARDRDRSG